MKNQGEGKFEYTYMGGVQIVRKEEKQFFCDSKRKEGVSSSISIGFGKR